MTKQETLQAFFDAWSELDAMPKAQGRPSMELQAARDLVQARALAVRNHVSSAADAPAVAPTIDPAVAAFRALNQQIAAIPPKDGTRPNAQVTEIG